MVFFGYSAKGRFTREVSIQTVRADGKITRAEILEGPFPSMIHDFAVTKNWIVVPIFPLTSSMERAMAGKPPFAWEPDKGTHIAFIPRNGSVADAKWIHRAGLLRVPSDQSLRDRRRSGRDRRHEVRRGPALPPARRLALHARRCRRRGCPLDLRSHGQATPSGSPARRPGRRVPALRRALLHERLSSRLDRLRQHRRGQACRGSEGITHYDLLDGRNATWNAGADDRFGEPVLRAAPPRCHRGRRLGAERDLPFAEEARSDLAVFEATDIAQGPVALAHLSSKVPAGFHGNWRPGPL